MSASPLGARLPRRRRRAVAVPVLMAREVGALMETGRGVTSTPPGATSVLPAFFIYLGFGDKDLISFYSKYKTDRTAATAYENQNQKGLRNTSCAPINSTLPIPPVPIFKHLYKLFYSSIKSASFPKGLLLTF